DKGFEPNEKVDVVIRPEDIKLVPVDQGMIEGVVESVIFKGVHYEMLINARGLRWMVHSTMMEPVNTKVGMNIIPYDIHIMKKVIAE
ncbi:MAG TPA: spermidine/putrescine ABC transporter ATP-binding protein, partial [Clostridiaceae bacterium]|nr:spermidine/putrescine ABC transporter ATP-binding protein [Clostridiaceae bacterium]